MSSLPQVAVITSNRQIIQECEAELSGRFTIKQVFVEPGRTRVSLIEHLRGVVQSITGELDGNINVRYAVVDHTFVASDGSYPILASLFDFLPGQSGSLLKTLLGAGIPTLVNDEGIGSFSWDIALAGGKPRRKGKVAEQLDQEESVLAYDRHTLEFENAFAPKYDREELSKAGTLSAIRQENDHVKDHIKAYAEDSLGRLNILDLGCGTGRFEENLLADRNLRERIASILAVDFAPMFLVESKKRLRHFLDEDQQKKISFSRRVAESSHLPAGHFDVVLASFGIVCFSRSHMTLREAFRVLKPDGLLILNVYNRDALTFEFDESMQKKFGRRYSHFAMHIDLNNDDMLFEDEAGKKESIKCFTFNASELQNLLKLVGFDPKPESIVTFPALYGIARKEYWDSLRAAEARSGGSEHRECAQDGPCTAFSSYQNTNLELDPHNSNFLEVILKMDSDLQGTKSMAGRGLYLSMIARKVKGKRGARAGETEKDLKQ